MSTFQNVIKYYTVFSIFEMVNVIMVNFLNGNY